MFGLATTLCLKSDLHILASIFRSIQRKSLRALPCPSLGHAVYFGFNASLKFSKKNSRARALGLASLGHVVYFGINLPLNSEKQMSTGLPRFARPCGLSWLQSPVKFTPKIRDVGLASLGHVVYFFFNPLKCLIND